MDKSKVPDKTKTTNKGHSTTDHQLTDYIEDNLLSDFNKNLKKCLNTKKNLNTSCHMVKDVV
jgi:hypothetical protein